MAIQEVRKEMLQQLFQGQKDVLVEFQGPWCTYCRRLEDAMSRVALERSEDMEVVAINIDLEPELAQSYGIEIVPTLVLFREGVPVADIVAPDSKAMIDQFLQENTAPQGEKKVERRDVVIIGGGPAGYTAALYTARAGLDTLVVEKLSAGGQMTQTTQIDNYSGFDQGIDGFTLGMKMQAGAERFGVQTEMAEVLSLELEGPEKTVVTSEGTILAKTVILATGAGHRHLGVAHEEELAGRGVAYCAACDGMFYRGKTVALVGGGNSAAADAMVLSRIAKKVILIHRRDTLKATKIYHEPLMAAENIEFRWNSTVSELLYDDKLRGVKIRSTIDGKEEELAVDGLFISVGRTPATELVRGQVELDAAGYIIADESTRTNLPGVFAVGDVRTKAVRQIITAASDGAVAAHYAESYLLGGE